MHMFIMIVSWHHLVLNISTKDFTRFFGSQSKIERVKWCINCNHMSCHKSCFMITRVIWLLFNWILSKKCQRTTFSRSYRNFHLSLIFIITSIVGGSWRHGSSYLAEWKTQVSYQVPNQYHIMKRWWYFHLFIYVTQDITQMGLF